MTATYWDRFVDIYIIKTKKIVHNIYSGFQSLKKWEIKLNDLFPAAPQHPTYSWIWTKILLALGLSSHWLIMFLIVINKLIRIVKFNLIVSLKSFSKAFHDHDRRKSFVCRVELIWVKEYSVKKREIFQPYLIGDIMAPLRENIH